MPPTSMGAATLLPVDTGPPPDALAAGSATGSPAAAEAENPLASDPSAPTASSATSPGAGTARAEESSSASQTFPSVPNPSSPSQAVTPSLDDAAVHANARQHVTSSQQANDRDAPMGGNAPQPTSPKLPRTTPLQEEARGFTIGKPPMASSAAKKPTKKKQSSKAAVRLEHHAKTVEQPKSQSPKGTSTADQPSIWSKAGTAQLRAKLIGTILHQSQPPTPEQAPPPEPALLAHFMCATKPANLRRDGDQRCMSTHERDALYAWMGQRLHLEEPPLFLMETHTSAERDSFAEFHRRHLGFRLFGEIPVGVNIPDVGAKYHLCQAARGSDEAARHRVLSFFNAMHTITVDPRSMSITIRFVQPSVRDSWEGFEFTLGKGVVRLHATDSLTSAILKVGFDEPARKLLYHVYFHGGNDLVQHAVRAIGRAAAGIDVLRVELKQSIALRDFHPTRWKLTFDQITCPTPLEKVRRIQVLYDNVPLTIDVYHPRSSRRAPCVKCLSIRHTAEDCKNKCAESSAASRTLILDVPKAEVFQLTAPRSSKKFDRQMRQLREAAAPELARELQLAEQRRLQKIERRTKATARQAAKEAAAEARAQQLAKEQVERDRKEQARQQTLQARNRVRAQLRQVQQQAKTKLKVFGSPTHLTTADQVKQPSAATGCKPLVDSAPPKAANPTVPDATPDASSLAIIPYVEPPPQTGKRHEPPSPTASEAGPPAFKGRLFEQDAATDDFELAGEEAITTNRDETPHQGVSSIAAGAEPAEADNTKPAARRAQRQLPLSAFFAPQTLVDAQAQLDQEIAMRQLRPVDHCLSQFPSPLLDSILHQLWTPSTLEDWKSAFRARIVKTPANGGCLHFAVHGCRARYIRGEEMFVCRTTVHEGNYYKDGMCNSLLEYLSQMLEDGTVTLTDFNRRFFGLGPPEVRDAAECAIRRFIEGIRGATLSHGLTRDQWGSDEDIFGLVWYVREPVIVIAEDAESQRTTVRVVRLERHVARGPEKIEQLFPEPAEAFEIVRTFLRHRVLPPILVFRPNKGNGHFDSFRFHDSLYKEWTTDDKEGLAMRARMDQVLVALGWYVAPLTSHGIPKHAPIDLISDSDSAYVPSEPMTSTPTPPSSPPFLSPPAAHALTSALNPRRRRRGVLANLWQQAEAANLVAYRLWDAQQDDCADRDEADTVNARCGYWSRSTVQLVALLRSLPYPEVALSLVPPALLLRLGNELSARPGQRSARLRYRQRPRERPFRMGPFGRASGSHQHR